MNILNASEKNKSEDNHDLYGLVVAGGESLRMGAEKGLLTYYDMPQQYHAYNMLMGVCSRVFLSCNKTQAKNILNGFDFIPDSEEFVNTGPMAALLTAYSRYPTSDFLVIGCDYPFVTKETLKDFLSTISKKTLAAAFYNQDNRYEPLLGWYSGACSQMLERDFIAGQHSLQQFLRANNAEKYYPHDPHVMQSIDTPEEYQNAKRFFQTLKPGRDA